MASSVLVQPFNNVSLLSTSDEEMERKAVPSNCTTDSSQEGTLFFGPFAFIKPIYDNKNWVSEGFTFVGCLDDWIYNQPCHLRIHILLKRRQIIFDSFRYEQFKFWYRYAELVCKRSNKIFVCVSLRAFARKEERRAKYIVCSAIFCNRLGDGGFPRPFWTEKIKNLGRWRRFCDMIRYLSEDLFTGGWMASWGREACSGVMKGTRRDISIECLESWFKV